MICISPCKLTKGFPSSMDENINLAGNTATHCF